MLKAPWGVSTPSVQAPMNLAMPVGPTGDRTAATAGALGAGATLAAAVGVADGLTFTSTCALVQQHWNPAPPSPLESFACSRNRYSPGALKVAVVVFLPPFSLSTLGLNGSNFTAAGPRNRLHLSNGAALGAGAAGAPAVAPRAGGGAGTLTFGPSSMAQVVSASPSPTVPVRLAAMPTGGPVNADPFGSNRMTGGVFLLAASSYGSRI